MQRKIYLNLSGDNALSPLPTIGVWQGSAVTLFVGGLPRKCGKVEVTAVNVAIKNADGETQSLGATYAGGWWAVTFSAAVFAHSGIVKNGVTVSADGLDELGAAVESWIFRKGDLEVREADGTIRPGEVVDEMRWYDVAPESPRKGDVAPLDGIIKIYTSTGWTPFGATSISWSDITDKPTEFPPEAHAASHKTGGSDALTPADIGAVAAVPGKGLSTNDYTTAEKTKLAGIEAGAEVNPTPVAPSTEIDEGATADAKKVAEFVNSSINAMAAFYITKNAAGDAFATKAELTAAIASGTFYNGGALRTPTKNDYLYVLADESATPIIPGVAPTTRYAYDGAQWAFQVVVNNTALTSAQVAAINSGITAALVSWLVTFKGADTSTTLASLLSALTGKRDYNDRTFPGDEELALSSEVPSVVSYEEAFGSSGAAEADSFRGKIEGKADLVDLPYNYGNYTASSTMTVDDGKISRIYSSGYTYLNINPTVTLPVPATNKTAECVLRWNTGSTVHAPTLALPSGKTAQSYSISGDTPEANSKYEMFVQIVPTSTMNTYEVISVVRKLA